MSRSDLFDDCEVQSVTLSPSIGPRRVEKLWFRDGTLVLATDTLLYRVYSGLLAQESPIFDDMLRIPQPADEETIEGCPEVRLSDDGRDVEYFLILESPFRLQVRLTTFVGLGER
ncbi:hypothetical protein B0H19DRAFT_934125 [Mycena capillaripes]|nr:hypothetical protein B0H19DRAFT_934125 [Mycena capillaripes]